MSDENNSGRQRRTVLKTGAAGLAGLTGLTTVAGASADQSAEEAEGRGPFDDAGTTISPGEGLKDEAAYLERAEKAEDDGIGVQVQDPTMTNLEYLSHVEDETTLDGWIYHYADIEYTLTVFEAVDDDGIPLTDSDGYYYYVAEYLAVADVSRELYEMEIGATANSTDVYENRDPATTSSINGEWVDVSVGGSVKGTGFDIQTATWVDNGIFGPYMWTPGYGGEYGIMYDGDWDSSDGSQFDIIGYSSLKTPTRAWGVGGVIDEWEWYGRAGR